MSFIDWIFGKKKTVETEQAREQVILPQVPYVEKNPNRQTGRELMHLNQRKKTRHDYTEEQDSGLGTIATIVAVEALAGAYDPPSSTDYGTVIDSAPSFDGFGGGSSGGAGGEASWSDSSSSSSYDSGGSSDSGGSW